MCPLNSYSQNPRALWANCYPVEACRTEILLIADCAGRQTVGLVVSTGLNPTFAGFLWFCRQDRAFDRLEQRQFSLIPSKARSTFPIGGAKARHKGILGTPAQISPIAACCMITPPLMPARAAAAVGRSAKGLRQTAGGAPRPRRAGT